MVEVKQIIINDTPDQHEIEARTWTCLAVLELLDKKYEIKYSINHLSKVLKFLGLVLWHPTKYSVYRNEVEIKAFILIELAEIHKNVC